uniref:HTH myb-type domain-containing protein n=1 Tax=Cannabis sativa TaxID=3483 RepID=A0A803RAF9_CANSA
MQCSSGMGFEEYIEALEVERKKIQVFQRELPLCLELVNQTIDRCKQQLSGTTTTEYVHGQSECSEQTSSEGHHVFEEFMPLKRSSSSDNEEEEEKEEQSPKRQTTEKDNKKKSDWLRSVQLWNTTPDPVSPQKEQLPKKASVTEVKSNGGAFQPFQREKNVVKPNGSSSSACTTTNPVASAPATSSNAGGGSNKREEDKDGQNQRKQRRNWSPELHKRFLNALQQLGGSHAATPKQIRELMKVDGLTNDEVKSHLQKYRLHTRRPTPAIHNNGNAQTPQVVFVGGIWMQPSEYAATVGGNGDSPSAVAANGIYAPVAAPAHHVAAVHRQSSENSHNNSEERRMSHNSHSEGGVHSNNSPSTSSSTHTTTTSPAF